MPILKGKPTLRDFQRYVEKMERERGFDDETMLQRCLLLGEEVGELFKAVRKREGMGIDPESAISAIEDEIADVFIMLCCIAEKYNIDIEAAFRTKEEKNAKRTWIKHGDNKDI